MRGSSKYGFAIALTLASGSIFAARAEEPKEPEFKGFYFGRTTLSEWRQAAHESGKDLTGRIVNLAPYCEEEGRYNSKTDAALGIKRCSWYTPSAVTKIFGVGQAGTKFDDWVFLDGVLAEFTALSYPAQLPNLLPALRAKYGEPTVTSTPPLQNAFGAQFTNEIYIWRLSTMVITVMKYAERLDTLGITISNPHLSEEIKRRRAQTPVDTKGL